MNEMDMDLAETTLINPDALEDTLNDVVPVLRTAEERARSRRELERLMEDRALAKEIDDDAWWN
ncbi:MAG: hypothetical protein AAF458_15460 [Pseudomonadota bacterium]